MAGDGWGSLGDGGTVGGQQISPKFRAQTTAGRPAAYVRPQVHRMARAGLGVAQHTYTTYWDTLAPLLGGTATWSLSTPTFGTTFGEIGGDRV